VVGYNGGGSVLADRAPNRAHPETGAGSWFVTQTTIMALFLEFLAQQWVLAAALLAVVVMLILHETRKAGPAVSPQQAINLVNAEQGVFLDLRDAADFKQGHIANALHIPSAKLDARVAELEKYRDKPVVLVCKMGQQAGIAGKQLKAKGFEKVYKMAGGMMEWGNLQLPTVK
jgi:rhodanese-related sulfurtransferase